MNNVVKNFKKGHKIHIKESQKGSFTKWCGGNVTSECIQRGKHSSNPKIRKKATFAANARKWKHENGGLFPSLKVKKHQAFVPGASITDSNPKAYKYLKKHKYSSGGFLKDVGDFLKSNSGMLDLGKSLFSGISDYKQTSSLLDGYQNKIAANANQQYEQALMDAEIERQKTPDIFTNTTGEVINQGVETIANGWQPFSQKVSVAKRKLDQQNAAVDQQIRDVKGQALGNMFGSFVQKGLGTLTSILG